MKVKSGSSALITCSLIFFLTESINFAQPGNPVSRWTFDNDTGRCALDESAQKKDSVYGSFEYVPGVSGNAIKLDGFRTYIQRDQYDISQLGGAFTIECWIALASYPWSWAPVVDCSYERVKGYFFGIGPEGHLGFRVGAGNSWYEITTGETVPMRKWTHVAAVFEPGKKITLFINGTEAASEDITGNLIPRWGGSLTIGRNNGAQTWFEPQLTTPESYFFLDGILDEITISGLAKTGELIRSEVAGVTGFPVPALSSRDRRPPAVR
ncbi:MAG: LamG domain-containing protein, partial [Bacteroidetes bacterium]